jgi:hypothetical protein
MTLIWKLVKLRKFMNYNLKLTVGNESRSICQCNKANHVKIKSFINKIMYRIWWFDVRRRKFSLIVTEKNF